MDPPDLFPWKCSHCQRINKKVATKCAICHAHWTSGQRHSTAPKQQTYKATAYRDAWPTEQNYSWNQWEEWEETDQSWNWQMPVDGSQSRAQSRSQSRSQSPRGRKGKGSGKNKGKSKTKGKSGNDQKGTGSFSTSPFTPLVAELLPWPSGDGAATGPTSFANTTTNPSTVDLLAQKKECLTALRNAYPDGNNIPADTKELIDKIEKDIDKLEKENNKFVTKNIHSATKSLGKAQKTLQETLDAKKSHRARWMKHITEAATSWQNQLQDYQKQQAAFKEVALKAKSDIETARAAIQNLSSTASQAQLETIPPIAPIPVEQEEGTGEADPEEEKLQGHLQTVLQNCAAALKVEIMPQTSDVEDLTMDEAERDKKRPRSMQPFGGSGPGGGAAKD